MDKIDSYYRSPRPGFPLEVTYYTPFRVTDKPLFVYCSPGMKIIWMQRGEAEVFVDGESTVLGEGDLFIRLPHQVGTFRSTSYDTRYVTLDISQELISFCFPHFFHAEVVTPVFEGRVRFPQWIRPGDPLYGVLLEQMQRVDLKKEGQTGYQGQLFSVVISIFAALAPHYRPLTREETARQEAERKLRTCLEYISIHYSEEITLQSLADLMGMHPNYLCDFFKRHTGKTVFEHLIRYRLYRAAKLLRGTDLTVSEIAAKIGYGKFANPFIRQFKRTYGCTPTEYRKSFVERKNGQNSAILFDF